MKRVIFSVFMFIALLVAPIAAFAQDAPVAPASGVVGSPIVDTVNGTALPNLEQDPGGFFEVAYNGIVSGKWLVVAAAALLVVVWFVRTFLGNLVPWFRTDKGGVVIALILGVLGAVANALAAGHGVDAKLISLGFAAGFAAMGGWTGIRKLLGIDNASNASKGA